MCHGTRLVFQRIAGLATFGSVLYHNLALNHPMKLPLTTPEPRMAQGPIWQWPSVISRACCTDPLLTWAQRPSHSRPRCWNWLLGPIKPTALSSMERDMSVHMIKKGSKRSLVLSSRVAPTLLSTRTSHHRNRPLLRHRARKSRWSALWMI